MKFGPLIDSCVPLKMFQLGEGYEGFLLHEIKSKGAIKYLFVFSVFKEKNPLLYFNAEKNHKSKDIYIGIFDEEGHKNIGIDNTCEDSMSFLMRALEYVCESFSLKREDIKEVSPKEPT